MYGPRASTSRPKLKDVSQRIVSAKLLQIKELRNQLNLAQHQLDEVISENRFLKTLQKRQEVALRKYEGHEARLPQLIQSHQEEVRILSSKLKQMKQTNHRLVEKLKVAEQQLSTLQEQHCHLVGLSRNQQLGEREMLAAQVRDLQHNVRDQNNTIQLLTRKVDLERKNYKHELGTEKSKRTELERKLTLAMQTIENLKDQIEAKEKCMNAIVPSRYVRTSHGLPQPAQTSRLTHSQIPRTPHTQAYKTVNQPLVTRRSSTDQTSNETDNPDSQNSNTTSDSNRTISGTTLPKIKPQIINRNLRNQFKLSSKQMTKLERTSNNDTPDYSSSLTSVETSFKDLRKQSESDTEKLNLSRQQLVYNSQGISRGRKFSVDSGVMNKSESGKMTQRTDQSSSVSSSKTRRNSISVCPTDLMGAEELDKYLKEDSLAQKIETHKSIKDELKELEEKLLQGSKFLGKPVKQKTKNLEADDSAEEMCKGMVGTPRALLNRSDEDSAKSNDVNWNDIHNKIKAESDAVEAKLEEYYSSLEKSELNLEATEDYIALEQEQKERLLKALKEIDKEAQRVSSSSSPDDVKSSPNRKPSRRRSDGYRYKFSKNVDNLHNGRPVFDNVKIPVLEKMRKEEKEYLSNNENAQKHKTEFMKNLFNNFEDVGVQSDNYTSSGRHNDDLERLVLSRSFE